jgi:hypothetical protein
MAQNREGNQMSVLLGSPSLSWRRELLLVSPVTAEELLASLAALPTARQVPVTAPLTAAVVVAGIEVASTAAAAEPALRRIWRERRGGGATPLLLLADQPTTNGSMLALGPSDGAGPLRSIEATALAEVMQRLASRPRLEAVRELADELERLDQQGIPGLKLRELLSLHTLDVRLRRDPQRWSAAGATTRAITRGMDWRGVLSAIGYHIEPRRQRGHLARFDGRPVLVVHPKADPTALARLDFEGHPPEGMLLNDCAADGAPYGLLACGGRLRLFEAAATTGSAAARYVELDTSSLREDDRAFLALLGPDYLAGGGFAALQAEAASYGAELRRRLDDTMRQRVLPALARGLGRWAAGQGQDLSDMKVLEELERACLTLVFRSMFVAYAEGSRYLPVDNRAYQNASLTALVAEAAESQARLGPSSTSLWDRFGLLVKAMRNGNPAWGVPAYNGGLFSASEFDGAATLERAELADPDFAAVLLGMGHDPDSGGGIDYSTLEIGHLGHIYEGLLSLRLSAADTALAYEPRSDRYTVPGPGEVADVEAGDLLWQTNEGGRKGGGVYYTPAVLVSHLVRQAVVPAFERHLERVREMLVVDPAAAADELFDFAVLDPACGSAHFLVVVVNELADMVVRFLGKSPLPAVGAALERLRAGASPGVPVEDVALLRRLVLKRCVFGVDVSPMGAEVAKLSLWLASFVPGLSLAYLGRNVVVGNSLVGVARPEAVAPDNSGLWFDHLRAALAGAAQAARRVAESDDRTPAEVEESHSADLAAIAATQGMANLFDLWTAEPFGVHRARGQAATYAVDIVEGRRTSLVDSAREARQQYRFLHWPLAFPRVFTRARPGFDVVVGNPPWEEVTVERLGFYALFRPGLRSLPEAERARAVGTLLTERPELEARLALAQDEVGAQRAYLSAGEYHSMAGDPDLYKLFCQRYATLLRDGGALGVVLPRTTFGTKGSEGFRRWLFEDNACKRVDFLLNRRSWIFDTHPQYTVALVAAERSAPAPAQVVQVAGTATSLAEWETQSTSPGLGFSLPTFGPGWTTPLLRTQAEADLLAKLRRGNTFPHGATGRWRCFPVRELDETNDKHLWAGATEGLSLWKGESFDQFDPHGAGARSCPDSPAVWTKVDKPKPGNGSILADELPLAERRRALLAELSHARVAFRDVTNRTNSRTVLACLVPPDTFLTNTAPYLVFTTGDDLCHAACLGIMNSLSFDWQARRFVELHVNFFILEGLVVPDLTDEDFDNVARAAARLSCVDERFADFAQGTGVDFGPLTEDEHRRLRVEIDARVARGWGLDAGDLAVMLADFTLDAVPPAYRRALGDRLAELAT